MNNTKSSLCCLDLSRIAATLDNTSNLLGLDELEGTCDKCGEIVEQTDNECPICHTPVVWLNSPTWKALYGDPRQAINRLSRVQAKDERGKALLSMARLPGFRNKSEAQRWHAATRIIGPEETQKIIDYIKQNADRKGWRGQAIVNIALNIAERKRSNTTKPHTGDSSIDADYTPGDLKI